MLTFQKQRQLDGMLDAVKGTFEEATKGKTIGEIMREKDHERKTNKLQRNREYLDEITAVWDVENK